MDVLIYDDELYDRMSDDTCPKKENFKMVYPDGVFFLGGYVESEISSLFIVHGQKVHFMVLKDRRRHAKELMLRSLDIWGKPCYCVIPKMYRSVINFAKNCGFREDGVIPAEHTKNGVTCDSQILRYGGQYGNC